MAFAIGSTVQDLDTGDPSFAFNNVSGTGILIALLLVRADANPILSASYASQSLSLAIANPDAVNGISSEIWYLLDPPTGSNTFTADQDGLASIRTMLASFTIGNEPGVLDQTGGADETTSVTISPTVDNCLIVAGAINEDGTVPTAGSGETQLFLNDEGTWATGGEYAIETTKTNHVMNFGNWTAAEGCIAAAAFRETAAGGTVVKDIIQNNSMLVAPR